MEEEKKDTDLKEGGDGEHQEEKSDSKETDPEVAGDLKNEDLDAVIDEILADGTPKDKDFKIKKEKYDELNEKSKLYDSFAPLLSRLNKNPELVDKILGNQEGETIENRLARLEDEKRTQRTVETRSVLKEAQRVWPDVLSRWSEMRAIVDGLEKQGVPYKNAVQRAYFAINPEAAKQEEKLVSYEQAVTARNQLGVFSSSSGATKVVRNDTSKYDVPPEDIEFGKKIGVSPELYQRHWDYIKRKGLDSL